MIFEIGDAIIYPHHGAGRIIDDRTIERNGEEREYYVVDILLKQQTVMLPKDEVDEIGVRPPTDRDEFFSRLEEIQQSIKETYDPEEGEHPEKVHQKTLESMLGDVRAGELDAMMEGLEKLHTRFLDQELNVTEKRVYDTAQDFMIGEIMALEDCTEEEAQDILQGYLGESLPTEPAEPEEGEEDGTQEEE